MDDIFKIYNTKQRNEKFRLALIKERGLQCEHCKNTTWNNLPIVLELHHKNGDHSDLRRENLELLCPNCHYYTDNYGSKKNKTKLVSDEEFINALKTSSSIRQALFSLDLSDGSANYQRARVLMHKYNVQLVKKEQKKKENFCIDCGIAIDPSATRCAKCAAKARQIVNIDREELKKLIRTTPFTKIGQQFGVSDNAIRKWCDKYNLPRTVKEIKTYSDEEWEQI